MLTGAAAGSTVSGLTAPADHARQDTVWQIQDVLEPDSPIRYLRLGERKRNEEQAQRECTGTTVVFVPWVAGSPIGVAVLLRVLPGVPAGVRDLRRDERAAQRWTGLRDHRTGDSRGNHGEAGGRHVGRPEIIPVAVLSGAMLRRLGLHRQPAIRRGVTPSGLTGILAY
jgi:hypothetical protein